MHSNIKPVSELGHTKLTCVFDVFVPAIAVVAAVAEVVAAADVVNVVGVAHGSVPLAATTPARPGTSPRHVDGTMIARADAVPTSRTCDPSAQTMAFLAGTRRSSGRSTPCTSSSYSVVYGEQ